MKLKSILLSAALGCSIGLLADARIESAGQKSTRVLLSIGAGEAVAAPARRAVRRTARRTSRRTSRRVARRYAALPHGCPLTGAYYYCGGVYYQAVVEDGSTVYVIVTP